MKIDNFMKIRTSTCTYFVLIIAMGLLYLIVSPGMSLAGVRANSKKASPISAKTEVKNVIQAPEAALIPSQPVEDVPIITKAVPYPYPVWVDFHLEWTNCQIHRVETDSSIIVTLGGTISSNSRFIWNLSATSPQPGGLPSLYFVEDIFGRSGRQYGSDIPLRWDISLDGGLMRPMDNLPDGSLTTLFPAGQHAFQVRITAMPPYHQSDGYYNLQLGQSLVPQL